MLNNDRVKACRGFFLFVKQAATPLHYFVLASTVHDAIGCVWLSSSTIWQLLYANNKIHPMSQIAACHHLWPHHFASSTWLMCNDKHVQSCITLSTQDQTYSLDIQQLLHTVYTKASVHSLHKFITLVDINSNFYVHGSKNSSHKNTTTVDVCKTMSTYYKLLSQIKHASTLTLESPTPFTIRKSNTLYTFYASLSHQST